MCLEDMSHLTPDDLERITSYVSDALSPEERSKTARWIAADQERYALAQNFGRMKAALGGLRGAHVETDVLVQEVRQAIKAARSEELLDRQRKPSRTRSGFSFKGTHTLRGWTWPAAVVVLSAFVVALWMRSPSHDIGVTHTYTTAIGQRATLSLDDGTRVMMAPQTTLQLVRFGQRSRTVVLDGDAYFEVASSARAPFIVQTGTSAARVLGTTFEVRHYRGDSELRVAVASGKVLVSSEASESSGAREARHPRVLVTMGQVLSVTDSTQNVRSVDDVDTEIGWLGDQLVFQGVPMAKVLETLTRWYGYRFQYTDSAMVRQIVTIGLSMRSSTEALATLEQILDVNLTVVGDTVKLTPVRSRAVPNQRAKHYDVWLPTSEVGR